MNRSDRRREKKKNKKKNTVQPNTQSMSEHELKDKIKFISKDLIQAAKEQAVAKALDYATTSTIAVLVDAMLSIKGIGINRINKVIEKAHFTFSCIESKDVSVEDLLQVCDDKGIEIKDKLLNTIPDTIVSETLQTIKVILIHGFPSRDMLEILQDKGLYNLESIKYENYVITVATDLKINTLSADYIIHSIYTSRGKIPDIRESSDEPVFNGIQKEPILLNTDTERRILFLGGMWGYVETEDKNEM